MVSAKLTSALTGVRSFVLGHCGAISLLELSTINQEPFRHFQFLEDWAARC